MAGPNLPEAKRAGLPVDLDRLTAEGDDWLSPEERYALKTHGICAQAQAHVFMIRVRAQGSVDTAAARGLATIAETYGKSWLHLTTRQQIELHNVHANNVVTVLGEIGKLDLTTNSACGHTMRGVMSCPDGGVGLEEPFDCFPDANAVHESILARTPKLNTQMPSRFNLHFGGCASCREHAKLNEAGFVSTNVDDELGYELWLGGSLGKSQPVLSFKAMDFLPRADVLPAVHALFDVFIEHGNFEQPAKARLKYLIADIGEDGFTRLFLERFAELRTQAWPAPPPVSPPLSSALGEILAHAPEGGWNSGVRPQRIPGFAMVTVNVPLGELYADDVRALAAIADDFADQTLYFTRNQNVMLRWVRLENVAMVRTRLEQIGLSLDGADHARDVRVCTAGPVCSLAITAAQSLGPQLLDHPALVRNSSLRVSVSGCPNACAQHQIADIGLSGGKVGVAGQSVLGYQIWLGGDLAKNVMGRVVGRVAEADVPAIVEAITGAWEALRRQGEPLSDTVNRVGIEGFQSMIDGVFNGRWSPGPEPEAPMFPARLDLKLPLVLGGAN